MEPDQHYCFTLPPGEDIYLFTLRNSSGTTVTITNYGATITSYKIIGMGNKSNDIMLGFDDVSHYQDPAYLAQYPWMGSAVGRYANRIRNATFNLNGEAYTLSKNNGNEQLHGGPGGFDRRAWKLSGKGESPVQWLELNYTSADGEEGFPGNLETKIRFELNDENELSYAFTATTDKATPVNLTHHAYFNLNNGEGSIIDHEIRIPASRIIEQDNNLVATGNILPVDDSAYDLREFHAIWKGLERIAEYDKSFIVDNKDKTLSLVAEARSPDSQTLLQVFSTEPILHFYSGKWMPSVVGKNNHQYGPFTGFCLETHRYPNAVNITHFPSTILNPGETFYQKTVYKVKSYLAL